MDTKLYPRAGDTTSFIKEYLHGSQEANTVMLQDYLKHCGSRDIKVEEISCNFQWKGCSAFGKHSTINELRVLMAAVEKGCFSNCADTFSQNAAINEILEDIQQAYPCRFAKILMKKVIYGNTRKIQMHPAKIVSCVMQAVHQIHSDMSISQDQLQVNKRLLALSHSLVFVYYALYFWVCNTKN